MQSSAEHLSKIITERHSDVKKQFEKLLHAFAGNLGDEVQATNAKFETALTNLGAVVAREDWPSWLTGLLAHTQNYRTNHNNGQATWIAHLRAIISYANDVENYVWFTSSNEEIPFDIDILIDAARAEFKIEELFDRILATLQGLAGCDELDSAKAIKDLEGVIAMLRRAKEGSFSAQITSWHFARRFVPNLLTCYLKSSKISGPAIDAFEKTAAELDINIGAAKDKISENVMAAARKSFRSEAIKGITVDETLALAGK